MVPLVRFVGLVAWADRPELSADLGSGVCLLFGFGAGRFGLSFGSGLGFGSVGWFPIGPADPFFPWYGASAFRFGFVDSIRFHDPAFFRGFDHRFPGAFRPLALRFDERFSNFRMVDRDPRILRGVTSVRAEEFGRGVGGPSAGMSAGDYPACERGAAPIAARHCGRDGTKHVIVEQRPPHEVLIDIGIWSGSSSRVDAGSNWSV